VALLFIKTLTAQQPANPVTLPADKKIDILLKELWNAREDTNKVNTLHEIYSAYYTIKNYSAAAKYNNEACRLSKQLGYIKGEARCLVNKAYECQRDEKWEEILTYSLPAAEMLKKTDDSYTKARCVTLTGYAYHYTSICPEAIKYFLEAVMYWKKLKNDNEIIPINLRLSECLDYMGNYTLALEKSLEALDLSIKTGNKPLEALSNQSVSGSYYSLKKYQDAKVHLEEALRINLTSGDRFRFAQIQNSIAEILFIENNCVGALEHISSALKIYETPGAPFFGKQWCYALFGMVKEAQGDSSLLRNNKVYAFEYYREALKDYTTALTLCEEINNDLFLAEKYIDLGRIYRKLHNSVLARTYLQKAIPLTRELSIKILTMEGYQELSSLDSMEGNFKGAFENSKQYKIYGDSLAMEAEKGRTESFTIQAEINKKEDQIKLLAAENKLNTTLTEKRNQQKKFAYGITGIIILLSGYAFYRYRRFSRNKSEQKILRERLKISQDLHDNVGSTLSSISVFSKVAQVQGEQNNKEELQEVLGRISDTSNEMVSEMNDIVWAINPKNDSMERIIQRMESFAKPILATRNISFNLSYEPSILLAHLDMDKRKNFYLIYKEAITNAFKYSGCSKINAGISNSNRHLELTIKDNGVGFDVQREIAVDKLTLSGNGLRNMKARAEEMKGELEVNSISGEGTEIKLGFPIP